MVWSWCILIQPSVTLGLLTPAHQAVVYMQISQSALSQDIVNICYYPRSQLLPLTLTWALSDPATGGGFETPAV